MPPTDQTDSAAQKAQSPEKNPILAALGERVRTLRTRRGLTRKALAQAAGVSERHLANLEYGTGNASILILWQVAQAVQCSLAELLGDETTQSAEWLLIRELLARRDDDTLRKARLALAELLGAGGQVNTGNPQASRIALIGLRGAGKSTLGRLLAERLGYPFFELSREIEKLAGYSVGELQSLYGQNAYRRYERRALEEAIQNQPQAVIAMPGGVVSDPSTYNLLLARCHTVWLQAAPEDHMRRVAAQGDTRPMAASAEAMEDLKSILAARSTFYAKADLQLDTSAQGVDGTLNRLVDLVRVMVVAAG